MTFFVLSSGIETAGAPIKRVSVLDAKNVTLGLTKATFLSLRIVTLKKLKIIKTILNLLIQRISHPKEI